MEETMKRVKDFVRSRVGEQRFSELQEKIDAEVRTGGDEDVVTLSVLLSDLDQSRILDHMQNFEIPLNVVQKVFERLEGQR